MSTEIAIRREMSLDGLAAYAQDNDAVAIAGDPLFFKKGVWYRGDAEFSNIDKRLFVVNVEEAYTGWTRWEDKKPVEHRLVRCLDYSQRITRDTLGHFDKNAWPTDDRDTPQDPWQQSDRIVLKSADTDEDLFTFISSSVGGRNALAKLLGKVAKSRQGRSGRCPIVALEGGTYDHESYGVVHFPVFRIVDWQFWDREMEAEAESEALPPPAPKGFSQALNDEIPF